VCRRGAAPGRGGAVVGGGVAAPGEAVREGILGLAIGVVVEAHNLRGVTGLCPVDAVVLFSDGFQKRLARGAVHPRTWRKASSSVSSVWWISRQPGQQKVPFPSSPVMGGSGVGRSQSAHRSAAGAEGGDESTAGSAMEGANVNADRLSTL